jgi:hypothetical protein
MTVPDWVWIAALLIGGHVVTGTADRGPCKHRWVRTYDPVGYDGNRQRCTRCNIVRMISEETE